MRVEVPVGYKVGEIAHTASVLVDEIVKTEIPGTHTWSVMSQYWLDSIRGIGRYRNLRAIGLMLGYRGYLDNVSQIDDNRGISLIVEEPRIIVFADEELLSSSQMVDVSNILIDTAYSYDLKTQSAPPSLIFPKEVYATELVKFDSKKLG